MSVTTPPPKHTPGALVFGVLGLAAYVISLVLPWYQTYDFEAGNYDGDPTGVFELGLGSGLYFAGVLVVTGFATATLLTRGAVRTGLGVAAFLTLAAPIVGLFLFGRVYAAADEQVLERAAEINREDPPHLFLAPYGGPILAAVALFLLAVAIARFTWPDRSTIGYAIASAAAVELVLVLPWASREVIYADRVEIVDYWFPHHGVYGLLAAVAAVVALMSAVFTIVFVPRTWWPPLPGIIGAIGAFVAVAPITSDEDVTPDPRFADALSENVVINSGIPLICAFAGFVMFSCTLAVSIVHYRRAHRATPPRPAYLPTQHW